MNEVRKHETSLTAVKRARLEVSKMIGFVLLQEVKRQIQASLMDTSCINPCIDAYENGD